MSPVQTLPPDSHPDCMIKTTKALTFFFFLIHKLKNISIQGAEWKISHDLQCGQKHNILPMNMSYLIVITAK